MKIKIKMKMKAKMMVRNDQIVTPIWQASEYRDRRMETMTTAPSSQPVFAKSNHTATLALVG